MPDLSAEGRPLFTDQDIADLAEFLCGVDNDYVCQDCTDQAHNAFSYLAAAGRLLPPDSEHREEWGVVWRSERGGVVLTEDAFLGRLEAEVHGRRRVGRYDVASFTVRRREHRMFDDGSTLTGPWVEVDGSVPE